jgi:general secretion pathway protein G
MGHYTKKGFTIAEMLIVVVVLGVLAMISIVAYEGIQDRANESVRTNDMRLIVTALELYNLKNESYPDVATSGLGSQAGWEASAREAPGEFLQPLVGEKYGFPGAVPVDPVNDGVEDSSAATIANGTESYYYYRYPPGYNTCDGTKGEMYVLAFGRKTSSDPSHPDSPGFSCPGGRNWGSEYRWVTGGYEGG